MTPPLLLRPEATAEIQDAFGWYERQRLGLGGEFLQAVRETLRGIEQAPLQYPKIRGEVRRALLRRFPYSILYVAEKERTVVFSCFHGKRDPRRWQSRRWR
jgi:plasmid stabilization system protein ParE